MKPESADFFAKAKKLLIEADLMIEVGLFEAAGRNAYIAGCHAARGLLFEHSNEVTNRHQRLWGDFTKALHSLGIKDSAFTGFLPNTYSLKRIADYETGGSEITKERVEMVVAHTAGFVDRLCGLARTL